MDALWKVASQLKSESIFSFGDSIKQTVCGDVVETNQTEKVNKMFLTTLFLKNAF